MWTSNWTLGLSLIALCAALVLGGTSGSRGDRTADESRPAVRGSTPTVEQLVGTWREERPGGPAFVRFDLDGTFAIDTEKLDVPYYAAGTYELEGDEVAFVSTGPDCASSWSWRVGLVRGEAASADELDVVFLNAWCQQLRGTKHTFGRE